MSPGGFRTKNVSRDGCVIASLILELLKFMTVCSIQFCIGFLRGSFRGNLFLNRWDAICHSQACG